MDDNDEFRRVSGKVPIVDGADLATGGVRRDDGTLAGQAYDLKYDDELDDDEPADGFDPASAAAGAAALAAIVAVAVAVPHVKKAVQEKLVPGMKNAWNKRPWHRQPDAVEAGAVMDPEPAAEEAPPVPIDIRHWKPRKPEAAAGLESNVRDQSTPRAVGESNGPDGDLD